LTEKPATMIAAIVQARVKKNRSSLRADVVVWAAVAMMVSPQRLRPAEPVM
jgi:hypothetical protein